MNKICTVMFFSSQLCNSTFRCSLAKVNHTTKRIAVVKLETDRNQLNIISVNAPENNKP